MAGEAEIFLLPILAIIFPPAAVAFLSGCGGDFCLNCLLTLFGWLPGCIHAFWLIIKRTDANDAYGRGNWTYTGMGKYSSGVQGPSGQTQPSPWGAPPPQPPPPGPPPGQYGASYVPPPGQPGYDAPPPPPPAPPEGHQVADQKTADQKPDGGQSRPPPQPSAPTSQQQDAPSGGA